MNYLWITIFGIAFIFVMTTLGAAIVFCFKKKIPSKLNVAFLGLASGIMLAASIWSLLLPAFEESTREWGEFALIPVLTGFLLGAAALLVLDKFTPVIRAEEGASAENVSAFRSINKLFLAVSLHNIPEGLAVGFAFGAAHAVGTTAAYMSALTLAIGIGVQNFPEGAAVSLPLSAALNSRKKAFLYGMGSGLPEPIFAALGYFLAAYIRALQPWLLAFSAGAMIFVVFAELIPQARDKENEKIPLGACCAMLGFALMTALDIALG